MPQYRYHVRTSAGAENSGTLAAETVSAAASILREQGLHVLQVVPVGVSAARLGGIVERLNVSTGPGLKDVLDFTTQLAVMTRAGIGIRQALEGIADQVEHPRFKRILQEIRMDVEGGKQFSEAIARYPKLFSPLYVSMVRASEMSGSFAKMLDRIASYLAQEVETRRMVVGASIYPGLIATMAVAVTVFLLTFVLPRFAAVFSGREDVLPGPTKFLMGLSSFMIDWWWMLIVAIAAGIFGGMLGLRTATGRLLFDRFKISCPGINKMFRALYISRSLHTMGQLLNAGVPVLDTIAITGDIAGNAMYRRMWRNVYGGVKQGRKIQQQLVRHTLLPKSVIQMIGAGEESGKLGEVLEEVSTYYHRVLRDAIKAMTGMIEPLMIVVMGSCVGFIAMAIILPIFKMSSLVTG
ncbi:MAG: type II secretion system F family protein [Phycisphaerales bacterium]|jgi:type IV pilus assembly protein PilC|nr:type II secretion system F family protein [Planctomycetota bacterium]